MFYLLFTKGFVLEINQTPLTLHKNCLCPLAGSGGTIFIHRAEVGL